MTDLIPGRIVEERLKKVMRADIKIKDGSGATQWKHSNGASKALCIMEATAYILGYETIDDEPPCTSAVIRDFMINLNDHTKTTDRNRAALKKVIPDIVQTAPTKWIGPPHKELIQAFRNPTYRKIERQRGKLLDDRLRTLSRLPLDNDYDMDQDEHLTAILKSTVPFARLLDLIRDMATLGKFPPAPLPGKQP